MVGRVRGMAAAAAAVAAGLVAPTTAARAVDQGTLTLDATHTTVTWHGASANPSPGYRPPVCTTPDLCDTLHLDVALPAGTFTAPNDGVLVSIKWATDYDQYNLYVYDPGGTLAAEATDVDSNGQSLLLKQPQNGVYTVQVVPFYTTFPEDLTYQGSAQVWLDPVARTATGTELLPRLQTVPPSNFHIADVPPVPSNPTGWRWTPDGTFASSCYLDETVDFGSTRCLRFDNDIRNVGPGALKLRFRWDQDVLTQCTMEQEIDVVGGVPIDRNAGPCTFHAQHAHFHYQNMAWYQLFAVDADGHPGTTPVARSYKLGFCAIDVDDWAFGGAAAAQRPRAYSFPTCNVPNNIPAGDPAVWEYMGISPGWGDVYTWDLPGQYLDVSNVGDGVYELVSRANPDGGILESASGLETGITCIRITGNTVTALQTYPSQSNTAALPLCHQSSGRQTAASTAAGGNAMRTVQPQSSTHAAAIAALPNTASGHPLPGGTAAAAALVLGGWAVRRRGTRRGGGSAPVR